MCGLRRPHRMAAVADRWSGTENDLSGKPGCGGSPGSRDRLIPLPWPGFAPREIFTSRGGGAVREASTEPMRRIFFVHIPRTGGTTIEALMRRHLTEGTFHNSYWEGPLLNRKRGDLLKSDYFIGHNFYYAREILPPVYSFTFLRDPVERLFSLWMFMLEHNPELAARFDDFMDCARRNPHFSNHQVRFLAGRYDVRRGRARVRTREIPRQRMIREVRARTGG